MLKEEVIKKLIRDVPDFPTTGILFRDITPILQNHEAFQNVVDAMVEIVGKKKPDIVIGIESRGFILGAPIALSLGAGFVPVRKVGKLPCNTVQASYALEYGSNMVEMHSDAIEAGQRVVIVDDLLATGGTASAAVQLTEELGGKVAGLAFLIELEFLQGRKMLANYDIQALIKY